VEGASRSFSGGSDVPAPITEGKVDGDRISFKVGSGSYSGTVKGDRIELERPMDSRRSQNPPQPEVPAVGPAPDGSDPSRGVSSGAPRNRLIVLHRVER
jgi:beta-galactosidase